MREIKFRVWDGSHMNDVAKTNYVVQTGFIDRDANHEKNIWLQYTGLKDMNGVDIYEGDLLEGYDPESKEEIRPIMGVYWSNRGMWDCESFILGGMNESCEIVGNIYENPELLNQ